MYIRTRILITIVLSSVFLLFSGSTYAWIWSWNNSSDTSPYCADANDCTLEAWVKNIGTAIKGSWIQTNQSITTYVVTIIQYLLSFISLIAVIYVLYAGFQIMIGGGDEEKTKKAKNIIIYIVVGISIMWLAYAIVSLIIEAIDWKNNSSIAKNSIERSFIALEEKFWFIVPSALAYTENDLNTFADDQKHLQAIMEIMESDFRLNKSVSSESINQAKAYISDAYNKLPDNPDDAIKNSSAKRAVDLAIWLMEQNPSSWQYVGEGIGWIWQFLWAVHINHITGAISANPNSGNVPFTSSFIAAWVTDPSGVTPPDNNFIWWKRENGWNRVELGRGKTLRYTFSEEWTYQIALDVISGSRNSKGYTDVLPLSVTQTINAQPRLWNIILLINGVNVSDLDTIKINPDIGKIWILLDATASRAVSNGTIIKTKWDFGNGNAITSDGPPVVERQIFANQGTYNVRLELTTNEGTTFTKDLQLVIRDPAAVIQTGKQTGNIGETFNMNALSYFTNNPNVEYTWQVIPINGDQKSVVVKNGPAFSYIFPSVGDYVVTLTSKNANGNTDSDSKTITIESREPTINLSEPKPISQEKPNTFLFDASQSFDTDTNTSKDLTYNWKIDGNDVTLSNQDKWWSIWTYTFSDIWNHTVSLTISNIYGKISTISKDIQVLSTLTVSLNVVPRAAPINTSISMQARSPKAAFYEWDLWDGTQPTNGTSDHIDHVYKKTGIYTVALNVKNIDGSQSNSTTQKVYVTDTYSPFALIDIKNGADEAMEDPSACGNGAFIADRSQWITIDGSQSINVDGNSSGLSYTWKYLDQVKPWPTLSEKFTELGCFPIELTVRSEKTWVTSTSQKFLQIKNLPPKFTSITSSIDTTKKDSQQILVNVSANGAIDPDGVITSYIWFYKTESDSEPQSVHITQSPKTTFVVPNVTEKYTFWVIIEDNDGARVNSTEYIKDPTPLIVSNEDGNVNLPLITLNTWNSTVLAGQPIDFVVTAKNILGTDITNKSTYQWDFDGDGRIDKKTTEPHVNYVYPNSGNFNMKVKVSYNGISNSKFQTMIVKNELKSGIKAYQSGDNILLVNTSEGSYDAASWTAGSIISQNLLNIVVPSSIFNTWWVASLTVSSGENETSTAEIKQSDIVSLPEWSQSGVLYQTYPESQSGIITVKSPGQKIIVSLFGNTSGNNFSIDSNTKIDSDIDGTADNDTDNKNSPSYTDGSAFEIPNENDSLSREQQIKLTVLKNGIPVGTQLLTIIRSYIVDNSNLTASDVTSGTGSDAFSTQDKSNLDAFQTKIRSLQSDDRIIFTQAYNKLVEDWDDGHDRTQNLLDIQGLVDDSKTLSEDDKKVLSDMIDTILVWNAQTANEVNVASQVISGIIPVKDENRVTILSKLEEIKWHPSDLANNKIIGKAILDIVKTDSNIPDGDKILIKSQLSIIVNGGQASIPASEKVTTSETWGSIFSNILWFIVWVVKVFWVILWILLFVLLLGYIAYRISRKNNDTGFQDFLIDSVFHINGGTKKQTPATKPIVTPTATTELVTPVIQKDPLGESWTFEKKADPLESLQNIPSAIPSEEKNNQNTINLSTPEGPLASSEESIPDWLKPISPETKNSDEIKNTPTENINIEWEKIEPAVQTLSEAPEEKATALPDWLTWNTPESAIENTELVATNREQSVEIPAMNTEKNHLPTSINIPNQESSEAEALPDWLKNSVTTPEKQVETKEDETQLVITENPVQDDTLRTQGNTEGKTEATKAKKQEAPKKPREKTPSKNKNTSDDLPEWLK